VTRTLAAESPPPLDHLLDRLTRLHPKAIDLSLGRVERLLAALGRPEKALPPVIHVAGTNGKGSVIAYARAALEAAGYRVHVYTSPHLVRFNERIRLAGELVDDERLIAALLACEAANRGEPITFFEITTAAAFLLFRDVPADIVMLETGLGGRLDATNVIEKPYVTAITPVSIDHTQFLGNTIAEIAREKAGILKPGVTAVIAEQSAEALAAIRDAASSRGAFLFEAGHDWRVAAGDRMFTYEDAHGTLVLPRPALEGTYQIGNAGTAIALLRRLAGFRVDASAIAAGLRRAEWPARLQRLTHGPLAAEATAAGIELWLDGGHNPAAGAVLAAEIAKMSPRTTHLVFAMVDSKDPEGFLAPFRGQAQSVWHVPLPPDHTAVSTERVRHAADAAALDYHEAASPAAALDAIAHLAAGRPVRVLICGSLYLAGEVLRENG
jgi:dihydrofolate synthase/folylpolyglutamate synthase